MYMLDEEIDLDRYKNHTIEVVVDRLVLKETDDPEYEAFESRLTDSIETALQWGDRQLLVVDMSSDPAEELPFSESLMCPVHGTSLPEIEPRTFSFNTPHGACPDCQGLGIRLEIDPDLIIPDRSLSIAEGAVASMEWTPRSSGHKGYYMQILEAAAEHYDIDLEKPVEELPEKDLDIVLYGTGDETFSLHYQNKNGREAYYETRFEGIISNLERRFQETESDYIRTKIQEFMSERSCPSCQGQRLRPEALAVTIEERNIHNITQWPVAQALSKARWM